MMNSKSSSTFDPSELSITVLEDGSSGFGGSIWHPGDVDGGNLGGTISSWNEVHPLLDPTLSQMPDGILSRSGWTIQDDSHTPLFEQQGSLFAGAAPWNDAGSSPRAAADWYFFGCGWSYKGCLHDWTEIAGRISMPPRAAFGIWVRVYS